MKTRYYLLLAAMGLLASCQKEMQEVIDSSEVLDGQKVLTVNIDQETKTHLGDVAASKRKVYWSNGDQVSVNGSTSDALTGLGETVASADFHFDKGITPPFNILYPSSIAINDDVYHVNLPAIQVWEDDNIANGMFPMAGYSGDGSSTAVHHLCAVLKLSIKQETPVHAAERSGEVDTDNIVAVRFKGKNSEKVNGTFAINYSTPALTADSGTGSELEVKVVKNQETSTSEAILYYIVIPARTYSNGFDIIVQDVNGHIMTKSKAGSWEAVAGKQYNLAEFDFVKTGDETGIEISTVEELIAFATNFNNRQYEDDGESLIVKLTSNLTFNASSSASFQATGGIGNVDPSGNNYFKGFFNGNNKTISGLTVSVPLFAFTDTDSRISDLTLDEDCVLTIDASAEDTNHGPLAGRNKGLIKNCTSAASVVINNIEDVETESHHYGGLVGRNYGGTIDECSVSGNVSCTQTDLEVVIDNAENSTNAIYIGGLSGSNADNGTISSSNFTGNITVSDGNTYGGISTTYSYNNGTKDRAGGWYFYVAGLVGYADNGSIASCTAGVSDEARSIDLRGTVVPSIGGIAGWVKLAADTEIKDCNNYMSLSFASSGARANTTPCRVGGIAARSSASISGSNNDGPITTVCNSTSIYLAGIVADGADVSDCNNNTAGTITRTGQTTAGQANRYIYIGGIMGCNNSASDVDHCNNNAAIVNNTPGTSTSTTVDMGGIVGWGQYQIDISDCDNNGTVTSNNTNNAIIA